MCQFLWGSKIAFKFHRYFMRLSDIVHTLVRNKRQAEVLENRRWKWEMESRRCDLTCKSWEQMINAFLYFFVFSFPGLFHLLISHFPIALNCWNMHRWALVEILNAKCIHSNKRVSIITGHLLHSYFYRYYSIMEAFDNLSSLCMSNAIETLSQFAVYWRIMNSY